MKILIVEDEFDLAKMVRKRLQEAGYETMIASDGYMGVKLAHEQKPDLIMLDLKLPAGGGMTVLKSVRLAANLGYIPIVVLTGMQDEQYKKQILDMGVDAYLEKPYDPAQLIETIKKVIVKKEP